MFTLRSIFKSISLGNLWEKHSTGTNGIPGGYGSSAILFFGSWLLSCITSHIRDWEVTMSGYLSQRNYLSPAHFSIPLLGSFPDGYPEARSIPSSCSPCLPTFGGFSGHT